MNGTVHAGPQHDPLWYKDAVIYQLHVKSFFDSNDDGIGDFPGLIARLDYIVSLGVNTLWLLPFYPSPRRDDGYDIAAYEDVHPDYGSLADARRFIDEAHARGLRVITELVINHTSDQHPWFQRARSAPQGSPDRAFYVWSDSDQDYAGTRIIFCDTEKSNWTWDEHAGQYYWHRFYSHQPDLNFDNPSVLDSVLQVMRFWLDMGVDGLRLDAVPYLIEREGTSNENLPETHAILKRIRAVVDEHYPDRLLLAEANMWPEDVQEYFGNADECHMAFHFPLMPRMYMAIAREDRFPVTDILRQTPELHPSCQWAVFLRNHDELTLEMVTDSERDYLWDFYAADRRARINLGIRRRLAPLLERDRRRIELMTSLLLTMPGTPVLYYGDEIGMGDNIHLGDRDGVRTPMQWTIDRNGGFSRADPAQMVLPPLSDPLYGYQAINVEAQQRDAHSLLNWTRRMLAVRRRYHALGRGTLRLLYPGNRRILAYLRQFEDETLLCVANLSRTLQAVELDLGEFEAAVPVDTVGGTAFPPIGKLPYLLTLPPFGFYQFQLVAEAQLPDWHVPAPEAMPEYQTLVLRGALSGALLQDTNRTLLERDILPTWLAKRRWFGERSEGDVAPQVRIDYIATLADDLVLCELQAHGEREQAGYFVPLGIAWEGADLPALAQQLALGRVRRGNRVGLLTDAFALPAFSAALLECWREHARLPLGGADLEFRPAAALAHSGLKVVPAVRWLSSEQTNSSLVLDELAVLKLVRKLTPGVNPEAEIAARLAAVGFANTAPLYGEMLHIGPDGTPTTLAVMQGNIPNQGDAWRWTLDFLGRQYEDWRLDAAVARRGSAALADYDLIATALGTRLGELHAALALSSDDPAFAPERADAARPQAWVDATTRQFDDALDELRRAPLEDAATAAAARRLQERREALHALLPRLAATAQDALLTRVHGDFHLGQVLVAQGDAFIIDFEGEPARPLAQRREKSSPLRDVAGLLRSLDYAACLFARGEDGVAPVDDGGLDAFLDAFRERSASAFLSAYRTVLAGATQPWIAASAIAAVTDLFVIDKAAYEIRYEAAHRPHWIGTPVGGLLRVLDRLLGATKAGTA